MTVSRADARRILLLALGAGVLVDVVVPGNAAGIGAALVMAALIGAAFVVAGRQGLARFDPADAWLPVAALVFAALPAVRADDWLVAADLALAAALGAGTIACLAGGRITRGLVPAILSLTVGLVASVAVGAATPIVAGLGRVGLGGGGSASSTRPARDARVGAAVTRAAPVLRGLLLAVPVLALFALLFASADAVFAEVARTLLAWRPDLDLTDLVNRTAVVVVVAWGVAGLLAAAAGLLPGVLPGPLSSRPIPAAGPDSAGPPAPPWADVGRAGPRPGGRSLGAASVADMTSWRRLGSVEAATMLALVDLLFAGFVVLQLAYLFGGRDTLGVVGLTYAEYARRGFFELVAVAMLAGLLVVALDLSVASRSRLQLAASLVLLGLTAVVLLSAFVRLRVYQDAYGWTELRFVVVVAIGWLAVALAAAGWLLLTRTTRWTLHVLGVMALVTVAGMNVVGPQAYVAERNLERAQHPELVAPGGRTGLDRDYLASLGDEAVPAIVAALPGLAPADRASMQRFLEDRRRALATDPSLQGWPAWNLARARAREALAGAPVDPAP